MSKAAKRILRRGILQKLEGLGPHDVKIQSRSIYEQLKQNPRFVSAGSVGLYMSTTNEADTTEAIKLCFQNKKLVFLPKCVEDPLTSSKYMEMLKVESIEEVLALKPAGPYGLKEPTSGENVMTSGVLDVLILPGVGFTEFGSRIGHGAGYYDKFLSQFHRDFGKVPFLIGLALTEQIVEEVPLEEHDWKLDLVIYPRRS